MHLRAPVLLVLVACAAVHACSEATDGVLPWSDAGAPSPSAPDDAAAPSSSGVFDATTSSRSQVLINEISGGEEWIEIVNAGSTSVDLGGWKVADRDKDTGEPKLAEAATFPAGIAIAPHAYALVLGGGVDAGKDCPKGGQTFCLGAEFGISTKNGETIFLLDQDGAIAGTVVFPPADGGRDDRSWGRLPNADPDGGFAATRATPGAPNSAD